MHGSSGCSAPGSFKKRSRASTFRQGSPRPRSVQGATGSCTIAQDCGLAAISSAPERGRDVANAHRKRQAENPLGLVFTSANGKPLDGPNFLKRVFRPLLTTAKLPAVTFQSLRHAGNTLLAASGVPLKVLQGRLGHATSKTTFDVYSHAAPSDGKAAADLMGSLLRKKRGTNRGTTGRSKARDVRAMAKTKTR
jgi:hypothetical protein